MLKSMMNAYALSAARLAGVRAPFSAAIIMQGETWVDP